jgi:hypothetical protein
MLRYDAVTSARQRAAIIAALPRLTEDKMRTIVHKSKFAIRIDRAWTLWNRKKSLWGVLFVIFLVGILLISATRGILNEIGSALIIASTLGFTIDTYLRENIVKDAFEGAMGYFLPDDIKEAVRYLASAEWFAEEFSLTIRLEEAEDEMVKCVIMIRKMLKNISGKTQSINSYINVDDWGFKHQSQIIACTIKTASDIHEMHSSTTSNDGYRLHGTTKKLSVHPNNVVEALGEAVEYKRKNDEINYVLAYCARSPKIYVEAPHSFELLVGISGAQEIQKHPHTGEYELPGFYLPWQKMSVRWYPS